MTTNIICVLVAVGFVIIGVLVGFGKSLRISTQGIIGIAISVVACAMTGVAIMSIPTVGDWLVNINTSFSGFWVWLRVVHFEIVIFYIVLFAVFQVVRVIIVKVIEGISEIDNKGMKVVNKILGGVYVGGFVLLVLFLTIMNKTFL